MKSSHHSANNGLVAVDAVARGGDLARRSELERSPGHGECPTVFLRAVVLHRDPLPERGAAVRVDETTRISRRVSVELNRFREAGVATKRRDG